MLPGGSTPDAERRRARIVTAVCIVGIAAALTAYAVSPGVRHAVGHAAHSVKHAVSHIFDPDHRHAHQRLHLVSPPTGARSTRLAHAHHHASAAKAP